MESQAQFLVLKLGKLRILLFLFKQNFQRILGTRPLLSQPDHQFQILNLAHRLTCKT